MSEISNLSEVCRCCHSSGVFKSLVDPFTYEGNVEVYSDLIRDVLGIHIRKPPFPASHTICEQCVMQLRFCRSFKLQVLECERKFLEYCKNELFPSGVLKAENEDKGKKTKQTCVDKEKSKETVYAPSYSCEFCHQQFDKKQKMREHEANKHNNEMLSCKTCQLTFKSHAIRTMHMKKHNSSGNGLRCQHCDKYYGSEEALIEHINSHYKDDLYPCEICPKKFPYKHTLRRHKEWHKLKFTESHISLHECNICSMAFKKSSELRTHKVRSHRAQYIALSNQKVKLRGLLSKCSYCDGKVFSNSFTLKRHIMVVHAGVAGVPLPAHPRLRYKCDQCDRVLGDIGTLNRHKKNIHGDRKKERCNICNKLSANLKEHNKVHTKPRKCERCFKSFATGSSLNRHIKFVHMGERPYCCDQCGLKFRKVDRYKTHLRKIHNRDELESSADIADRTLNVSGGINE